MANAGNISFLLLLLHHLLLHLLFRHLPHRACDDGEVCELRPALSRCPTCPVLSYLPCPSAALSRARAPQRRAEQRGIMEDKYI